MNTLLAQVITTDFLNNVLKNHLKYDINISSIDVKDLVAAGNNYTSQLKRIAITYSTHKEEYRALSVIVKCFPETETQAKFVKEMKLFDCEVEVYNQVMPKIFSLGCNERMVPELYFGQTHPIPVLVLEDLTATNYRIGARRVGLDMEHSFLVVEKLACLHAATFVLHEKDPTIFMNFDKNIFPNTGFIGVLLTMCYEECIKTCRNVPEFNGYVGKLQGAKDDILSKMSNFHRLHSKFKVLNHGDCCTNNLMFYYDENGAVKDVALIDFQTSCFANPCLDLHYFLASSLQFDIRSKQNIILDHYFEHLIENLKKLKASNVPKREEFDNDFRTLAFYGFGASISILCFTKANRDNGATFENFVMDNGKDSFRYHCFNNDDYLKEIAYFLPFYDSLGTFGA